MKANFIRITFRILVGSSHYSTDTLPKQRRRFARTMKILFPRDKSVDTSSSTIAGVPVMVFEPKQPTGRTIIYLHGGGFVFGSAATYQRHTALLSKLCNAKVVSIDYGLSPENKIPNALDQVQAVWENLLSTGCLATKTTFAGDSAGANLALASVIRLRDKSLALPSCIVLLSPALDATFGGDSYKTNASFDPILNLQKLNFFMESYSSGRNKKNPYLSPLFANLTGLPPILVQVGTEEVLLSDSLALQKHAKRDNVSLTLEKYEAVWHSWQLFAGFVEEAKNAMTDASKFIINHT